jgi:hypothetical protein
VNVGVEEMGLVENKVWRSMYTERTHHNRRIFLSTSLARPPTHSESLDGSEGVRSPGRSTSQEFGAPPRHW